MNEYYLSFQVKLAEAAEVTEAAVEVQGRLQVDHETAELPVKLPDRFFKRKRDHLCVNFFRKHSN